MSRLSCQTKRANPRIGKDGLRCACFLKHPIKFSNWSSIGRSGNRSWALTNGFFLSSFFIGFCLCLAGNPAVVKNNSNKPLTSTLSNTILLIWLKRSAFECLESGYSLMNWSWGERATSERGEDTVNEWPHEKQTNTTPSHKPYHQTAQLCGITAHDSTNPSHYGSHNNSARVT